MKKNNQKPHNEYESDESHGLLNILKLIILVSVLVGAWFLLDWMINGK